MAGLAMAADSPTADTCLCGGTHWHTLVDKNYVWCRRCGAWRRLFEGRWLIPLDRAGELARSVPQGDESPTSPGTPGAKRTR